MQVLHEILFVYERASGQLEDRTGIEFILII